MELAFEDAQSRKADEDQARVRSLKLHQAKQDLAEARQAVERADADAKQRREETEQNRAKATDLEHRRQIASEQAARDDQSLQEIARQKAELDARRKDQEAQRTKDAEFAQRQEMTDKAAEQGKAAQEQAVAEDRRKRAIKEAVEANRSIADRFGFPIGYLDAKLMVDFEGSSFTPFVPLREWLSVALASKKFQVLTHISAYNNSLHGLKIKAANSPALNMVWRLESGELFLTATGAGDSVSEASDAERGQTNAAISMLYAQSLQVISISTGTASQ